MPDFIFRKSSFSGGNQQNECVEVATNISSLVAVRDSKQLSGPRLHFAPSSWSAFQHALGQGRFV